MMLQLSISKYLLNQNYKFFKVLAVLIWETGISSALDVERIQFF